MWILRCSFTTVYFNAKDDIFFIHFVDKVPPKHVDVLLGLCFVLITCNFLLKVTPYVEMNLLPYSAYGFLSSIESNNLENSSLLFRNNNIYYVISHSWISIQNNQTQKYRLGISRFIFELLGLRFFFITLLTAYQR